MRITIAQFNPVVGDVDGNYRRVEEGLDRAVREAADLVVFPELFVTGYPPKDLLEHNWFMRRVQNTLFRLQKLSKQYPETGIIVGAPAGETDYPSDGLYNAAILIYAGRIEAVCHKSLLPTYDVFDETRYFSVAKSVEPVSFKGEKIGISICEDAWNDPVLWTGTRRYSFDPIAALAEKGATIFINISASPFTIRKEEIRFRLISGHAKKHGVLFIYVNQIGGNDELIFDGRSLVVDKNGAPVALFPSFAEHIETIDTKKPGAGIQYEPQPKIETAFMALRLGLGDYMRKTGFSSAVVGLSGGIDSAVTAAIAADALGSDHVFGIAMPSRYSSEASVLDAQRLAENLGIDFRIVPIDTIYREYLETLETHFEGRKRDVTEENIQARIRGNILMAFSNKFGSLLLTTGNKSELAVGYCTMYGDMSGGLAVISDVPKIMVYELARYINRKGEVIPENILVKAPSAELRPDQTDQDTLPPYEILDGVLIAYIEDRLSIDEIAEQGFDRETVEWVVKTVKRNEYKRYQAAPGLKITSKAFGVGRRMPIASKY
jgi:NAD+ synthase (glutamine-hydrolysing)